MRLRRFLGLATLATLVSSDALGQSPSTGNLRDLLTGFLRAGITLAPPSTAGFPSHEAHFIGADSPQFAAFSQLSSQLANQLSTFPLASSAGGFTYRFDPALGVFSRASDSFGPIFGERADTIGRGKFNIGLNYSHYTFDRVNDLGLREGDLRLVFTHQDINSDHSNTSPFFEGDVITAAVAVKIETSITAFVMSYGLSDSLDVGFAVPVVNVSLDAQTDAVIQRLATGTAAPTIHRFLNGTDKQTFSSAGRASGVGDILARAKYRVLGGAAGGGLAAAAEVRLPTGDERDLLGTGVLQVGGFLYASMPVGVFSPHLNAGYRWANNNSETRIPDEISATLGVDIALSPRFTFAIDVLGRDFRNTDVATVALVEYTANVNPVATAPPTLVTAAFPTLVTERKDAVSYLGTIGFKVNPFGNLLLTVNGLFALNKKGLQDSFTPVVGLDYSF